MLSADDAVALCRLLEQHSIRFWVMGGWGVDALLHRETRPHKDLDILLAQGDRSGAWSAYQFAIDNLAPGAGDRDLLQMKVDDLTPTGSDEGDADS